MGWEAVAAEAEIESEVCARAQNASGEELETLETLVDACETLEPLFEVVEDRSPVLEAPGAYLARLDHRQRRIELNGHALDRSADSGLLRQFLVMHELFHAWVKLFGQTEAWAGLGLQEENAADLVALYSL